MKYKITLNGKTYEIEVEQEQVTMLNEYAHTETIAIAPTVQPVAPVQQPVVAAAPQPTASAGGKLVPSPLPGAVVAVKMKEGDAVKKGDVILVIEAMKMENEIVAPSTGTIARLIVKKGDKVSSGSPLFELV